MEWARLRPITWRASSITRRTSSVGSAPSDNTPDFADSTPDFFRGLGSVRQHASGGCGVFIASDLLVLPRPSSFFFGIASMLEELKLSFFRGEPFVDLADEHLGELPLFQVPIINHLP